MAGATLRRPGVPLLLEELPLSVAFAAEADPAFQGILLRSGELRLQRIPLELSGRVDGLAEPVRALSMRVAGEGISLESVVAFLPDSLRNKLPRGIAGTLALDARLQGEAGPGRTPGLEGRVTLAGGRYPSRAGPPLAEGVGGELTLSPERTLGVRLQGTALGGPFSVEGAATPGPSGALDLSVRGSPDLGRVQGMVELPEGVTMDGEVEGRLRVVGPLEDLLALPQSRALGGLDLAGELQVSDFRGGHPLLAGPVAIPAGELRLAGTRAYFQELPVALGDERVVVGGELRDLLDLLDPEGVPEARVTVRGTRLTLPKLLAEPPADTALTYGRIAFARVGGRTLQGRSPEEAAREMGLVRPASLPLAGRAEVALDTLIDFQGVRMEGLRAQVEFGPGFVRVTDARFRQYGGEMLAALGMALGGSPEEPFSLSLSAREVDASAFLAATTPLGRLIRGRVTLELELIGGLDDLLLPGRRSLVGSGRFALTGGGLASIPLTRHLASFLGMEELREPTLQDWSTAFLLEEGRLRLADATLAGAPGAPRVGGAIGLDGTLDLLSAFTLPAARLSPAVLERLGAAGALAARLRERAEPMEAVIRIGGSLMDPELRASPTAVAQTLAGAIQEGVRAEVEERVQEGRAEVQQRIEVQQAEVQRRIEEQKSQLQERATGFLRGLVQRRDTLRPDTVKPDTLKPDTVRPGTVNPDTVPKSR